MKCSWLPALLTVALCPFIAAAQEAPQGATAPKVVVIVAKTKGVPDVTPQVRQLIEKPLGKSHEVLPFQKYVQAARKAGVDAQGATQLETVKTAAQAAGVTHVVRIEGFANEVPPPADKPKAKPTKAHEIEVSVVDGAAGAVLGVQRFALERNKLTPAVAEQVLTKVRELLQVPASGAVAMPAPGPTPSAEPSAPAVSEKEAAAPAAQPAGAATAAATSAPPPPAVEEIHAAPASVEAPHDAAVSMSGAREPEVLAGLTLRELVGYGGLGVGGLLAVTGVVVVATRDDAKADYDASANTLTITRRQSRAPGYGMLSAGIGLAAAGAFALWVEPGLGLGIFPGSTSASVAPLPGGGALVVSGSW